MSDTNTTSETSETSVTIVYPTESLHYRRHGEHRPQPVVLELDPEERTLTVRVDHNDRHTTSFAVYHGRVAHWEVPALTQSAAEELLEDVLPLAERAVAGYDTRWNGSNRIGHYEGDGADAMDEISELLERRHWHEDDAVQVWDAADYLAPIRREAAELLGITAESTDADLERVEEELRAEARPALLEGVMEALEAIRERLQDEAAEAAEAAEEEAGRIAEAMAAADLECADDTDALARKVVADAGNTSGVRSCEWELQTIMHEHGCTEAVAIRAVALYGNALLRAAEEHVESLDAAEVA
jgi:hypothetical protein